MTCADRPPTAINAAPHPDDLGTTAEDAAALAARMLTWEREHAPADDLERFLVRQAATLSWRIERADLAEAALLSHHILSHASDAHARRLDRVLELGQKLIPADAEIRNLQNDHNGYYAKKTTKPERGDDGTHMPHYSFWPYRPSGLGIRNPPLLGDDPARTVAELESTPEGCRWLLNQWTELRNAAAMGRAWLTAEKFRACRLLGRQPTQAADDYAISDLFMACHVLTDGSESPFHELKALMSSTEYDAYAARLLARRADERRPATPEEATELLLATVDRAMTHLKTRLAEYEKASGEPGGRAERLRGSFDPGQQMARLHREQSTLRREFLKVLEALERRKRARARDSKTRGESGISLGAGLSTPPNPVRSLGASLPTPPLCHPRPTEIRQERDAPRSPEAPSSSVNATNHPSHADRRPITVSDRRRARDRARRTALRNQQRSLRRKPEPIPSFGDSGKNREKWDPNRKLLSH